MLVGVPTGTVPQAHAVIGGFVFSTTPDHVTQAQGSTSNSPVRVTAFGGYQGNVSLLLAETYDSIDISVQFIPQVLQLNSTDQSSNSAMIVSVSQRTLPGNYTIDVEGYDGMIYHTFQVSLTVTGQDFSISANYTRLSFPLAQNRALDTNVTVTSIGGFSGIVNVTVSVSSNYPPVPMLPTVSPSAKIVSIAPSAPASFPLTVYVNSSLVAHQYEVDVVGVGATTTGASRSSQITVVVGGDFNLLMRKSNLVVHQGSLVSTTLTFFGINGYSGTIAVYSGLISVNPPNPDIQLYPSDVSLSSPGTNDSLIVVKTDARTGLGTYHVAIEASDDVSGGHLGESLSYNVAVLGPLAGPDFAVSADPAQISAGLGTVGNSVIHVIGVGGYSGSVGLYTSLGASASFYPSFLNGISSVFNSSSDLLVTMPSPTPGGGGPGWWYSSGKGTILVIVADASGLTHETSINITATPYTFAAYPASQLARANSTVSFGFTVRPIAGFNGTVALTLANPPGLVATMDNTQLNFSARPSLLYSQLQVNVPAGTPDGVYTFQVTATYMRPEYLPLSTAPKQALTYSIPVDVTVWSPATSPTILGLQPLEFYGIVAGSAVAAVSVTYFVLRRRKPIQDSEGLGLGYVTGVLRRLG